MNFKNILLFLIIFSCQSTFCQKIRNTTYTTKKEKEFITFSENGTFERISFPSHFDMGYGLDGTFILLNDTLKLKFKIKNIENPFVVKEKIDSIKTKGRLQLIDLEFYDVNNKFYSSIDIEIDGEKYSLRKHGNKFSQTPNDSKITINNHLDENIFQKRLNKDFDYKINLVFLEKETEVIEKYKIIKAKKSKLILKPLFGNKKKLRLFTD